MPNFTKIRQTVAEVWRLCFLKMAAVRHIGFVGCDIGTTGDKQLVVSIFVQKLVEINAVVSII